MGETRGYCSSYVQTSLGRLLVLGASVIVETNRQVGGGGGGGGEEVRSHKHISSALYTVANCCIMSAGC